MSAPRSVANMFPYRFPAPVVPGSVAARPAVPSGPASSFPFRSPPSRSFPPRSFPPKSFPPRSFRTVRFALRSSDDLFPALGRVLPETTRSRPKLSDKPSYGGSRAPARPRRRRSSQLLGDYFRPPLVAPCPVSTPRPDSKPRTSVCSDTSVVREIRNKCRIFRAVPRPGSYRLRRHFPRLCNCSTRVRHPYRARSLRSGNLRLQSEVHTYEPPVIRSTGLVTLPDPTLAVREATAGIHNSES